MSYWEDSIREPLLSFGIELTDEQMAEICESIEVSQSNYGMFHGHDEIPNPLEGEIRRIKQSHDEEDLRARRDHESKVADLERTIRRLQSRISDLEDELRNCRR